MSILTLSKHKPEDVRIPKKGTVAVFIDINDGIIKSKSPDGSIVLLAVGDSPDIYPVEIPKLETKVTSYNPIGSYANSDALRIKWSSASTTFMSYNPKVWLFRPVINRKKVLDGSGNVFKLKRKKKYSHPSSNGGTDYSGSNKYGGNHTRLNTLSGSFIPNRVTEFDLPSQNEWSVFNLNPFQWFVKRYRANDFSLMDQYDPLISDDLDGYDFGTSDFIVYSCGEKSPIFRFSLAIVIDDPNNEGQKIIGHYTRLHVLRFDIDLLKFNYTDNKKDLF